MNSDQDKLNERLSVLRTEFASRCLCDADHLVRFAGSERGSPDAEVMLTQIRDAMHRIAGTGRIFGYAHLSEAAGIFEGFVRTETNHEALAEGAMEMAGVITTTFAPRSAPAVARTG